MARKLLLIFASLTLVLAGAALYFALAKPATSSSGSRTVIVATGDLPAGTRATALREPLIQVVSVQSNLVPPNAIQSLAEVSQLQTLVPVFRGQILMERMFAQTASTGGLSIPGGTNAVTLQMTDPGRVAGFVQPGSRVIIYKMAAGDDTPGKVVLPNARVIAVGPTTETGRTGDAAVSNKTAATTLVTFALTPKESIEVVGREDLYLGLLPSS